MRRIAVAAVVACSLAAALLAPSPLLAQTGDPGLLRLEPKLGVGTWLGSGTLGGNAEYEAGSDTIEMTLDAYGSFFFEVRGPNNGDVEGEWDIVDPSWSQNVFHFSNGATALFEGTYLGTGPVTGSPTELFADATVEQTGKLTVDGTGYQENLTDELLMPIGIQVTTAFCDEVYGTWDASWEMLIQAYQWEPHFGGNWVAVRQSSDFEDEIEDGITMETLVEGLNETLDRWDGMKQGLRTHDRTEVFTDEEVADIFSMINEVEAILNEIRNLTECDRVRYGEDNLEYFESALMDSLGDIITSAAQFGELSSLEVFRFVRAGVRTGAIGPGANGAAEEALRQEAEDILAEITTAWEEADGEKGLEWSAEDDDDVAFVAYAGFGRDWVYHVHDRTVRAVALADVVGTAGE